MTVSVNNNIYNNNIIDIIMKNLMNAININNMN